MKPQTKPMIANLNIHTTVVYGGMFGTGIEYRRRGKTKKELFAEFTLDNLVRAVDARLTELGVDKDERLVRIAELEKPEPTEKR